MKCMEFIQDVLIVVMVISEFQIECVGLLDICDLLMLLFSFNMNLLQIELQGMMFCLCGVGMIGNNIGFESFVGVFFDGVYLSCLGIVFGDQFDVEVIEVLCGFQGMFFGCNVLVGVFNLCIKVFSFIDMFGFVNFMVGNFNQFNIQVGIGGLIFEKVGFCIFGVWCQQDGFMELISGVEICNCDCVFFCGQLFFDFSEKLLLCIIGDYFDVDEQCCDVVVFIDIFGQLGVFVVVGLLVNGGVINLGDEVFENQFSNFEQFQNFFDQFGILLEWNYNFNDSMMLIYIGLYCEFIVLSVQYIDFNLFDIFFVCFEVVNGFEIFNDIDIWMQELCIVGDIECVFWFFGGFVLNEEIFENVGLGFGCDFIVNMDVVFWNFVFVGSSFVFG